MTAIEYLIEVFFKSNVEKALFQDEINKAKEMEKEQAERMYSEDEVDELVNNLISNFKNYNGSSIDSEKLKWFYQQLKKK